MNDLTKTMTIRSGELVINDDDGRELLRMSPKTGITFNGLVNLKRAVEVIGRQIEAEVETEVETEPWTLIPVGRENARVLRVNGVVGEFFREGGEVGVRVITAPASVITAASVKELWACRNTQVTSVERVRIVPEDARVLGEGEVAVPRELVERARDWCRNFPDRGVNSFSATILRDLAAYAETEGQA